MEYSKKETKACVQGSKYTSFFSRKITLEDYENPKFMRFANEDILVGGKYPEIGFDCAVSKLIRKADYLYSACKSTK